MFTVAWRRMRPLFFVRMKQYTRILLNLFAFQHTTWHVGKYGNFPFCGCAMVLLWSVNFIRNCTGIEIQARVKILVRSNKGSSGEIVVPCVELKTIIFVASCWLLIVSYEASPKLLPPSRLGLFEDHYQNLSSVRQYFFPPYFSFAIFDAGRIRKLLNFL